jgi:hypothetical protein
MQIGMRRAISIPSCKGFAARSSLYGRLPAVWDLGSPWGLVRIARGGDVTEPPPGAVNSPRFVPNGEG